MNRHVWNRRSGRHTATCSRCGAKRKFFKATRYYKAGPGFGTIAEAYWRKIRPPCSKGTD